MKNLLIYRMQTSPFSLKISSIFGHYPISWGSRRPQPPVAYPLGSGLRSWLAYGKDTPAPNAAWLVEVVPVEPGLHRQYIVSIRDSR